MVAANAGRSTRRWNERIRPAVLAASDICHWCGHPGARAVDHHPVPRAVAVRFAPELLEDPSNLRPIHGVEGCPVCPPTPAGRRRVCNGEKGGRAFAQPPESGSRSW